MKNVRSIEVEIHSYCNRKCDWCPNKKIDRSFCEIMPLQTYKNLLNNLKTNNFNGVISFSRYNEPMSNIKLLKEYTKIAKEILPNIKLVSNTNGDYFFEENLKDLNIDELSIMDYDCKGVDYCISKLKNNNITITSIENNNIYGTYKNMKIVYVANWAKHILLENRGGFLNSDIYYFDKELNQNIRMKWKNECTLRNEVCYEPIYFIAIDYNGNVMPCCHMRSDNVKHVPYILGNINNTSLQNIYMSKKAIEFRNYMSTSQETYAFPCTYCQKKAGRYTRNEPSILYS